MIWRVYNALYIADLPEVLAGLKIYNYSESVMEQPVVSGIASCCVLAGVSKMNREQYCNISSMMLLHFLTQFFLALCDDPLIVSTSSGSIRGTTGQTRLGRAYRAFMGIPYGEKPVGSLRFEPLRNHPGTGQESEQQPPMARDVFREVNTGKDLPILVYIHGGSFKSGSANLYRPNYFLDEDVILVTINYRLHSLGFLNTADGFVRGNMGLKDQIAALRWVKKNIANFGGDPNRVTIFGESAGGASVSYLLLSPLATGLFHKAISHSGTAFKIWSFQPRPAEQARLLAQRLHCPINYSSAMVDCLKKANGADIVQWSTLGGALKEDLNVFCPSVEIYDEGAAISSHPYDILTSGGAARVPWISGVNSAEGLFATIPISINPVLVHRINTNWSSVAPQFFHYDNNRTELTSKITKFYLGTEQINFYEQFDNFTRMFSDRLYISFTHKAAKMQSEFSDVYLYYNDYALFPGHNRVSTSIVGAFGVSHAGELPLFFPIISYIGPLSQHYNMSSNLVNLWTQFASGSNNLRLNNIGWRPVKSVMQSKAYLKLSNSDTEMVLDPLKERMELWDEINLFRVEPTDIRG